MSNWSNLCVLGYILNIVGPKNCANEVCKGWNDSRKIYTDLRICDRHELETFSKHVPFHLIKKLDMTNCEISCIMLQDFKSLNKLYLKYWRSRDITIDHLIEILQNLELLEEIDLGRCVSLSHKNIEMLSQMEKLQKLEIWDSMIDDEGIRVLGSRLENLRSLTLGNSVNITDKSVVGLIGLKLCELSLWNCNITDEGIRVIATIRTLTKLDVGRCKVTDEGLRVIANMNGLVTLDISETNVTDVGLGALGALAVLRELHIGMCMNVTDNSVESIVSNMKLLEKLNMRGCEVTDRGLRYLVGTKLNALNIVGCKSVNDDSLEILAGCKYLREVVVDSIRTTKYGRMKLEKLMESRHVNISCATL